MFTHRPLKRRAAALLAAIGWLAVPGAAQARAARGLTPASWEKIKGSGLYHTGEGWAEMKKDLGEARESAQARALADLARALRVAVRATMTDRLTLQDGKPDQDLEAKVETFTALALRLPLDERGVFLHTPRRGMVTAVAALSRRRYDALVESSLRARTAEISNLQEAARDAAAAGRPAEAARRLGRALEESRGDPEGFGLDDDPALENAVRSKVGALTGGWTLDCRPAVVFFKEGRDPAPLRVRARLGTGKSFAGAPLAAVWSHRPRHPVARAVTDAQGWALLTVAPDTFADRPTLTVGFDWPALSLPVPAEEPLCRARFEPRRTLRLRVSGAGPEERRKLESAVRRGIEDLPWEVEEGGWAAPGEAPEGAEPADIGLDIKVRVEEKKHPLVDLYRVRLTGTAAFYDFGAMAWRPRFSLPSVETEGADPAAAVEELWEKWPAIAAQAVRENTPALFPN